MSTLPTIQSTVVANSSANMSVLDLISSADTLGKLVILILIGSSIWSWALFFDKFLKIRSLLKKFDYFEHLFWSGQSLDHLYEKIKLKPEHLLHQIFVAAITEWKRDGIKDNILKAAIKERMLRNMELIKDRELEKIEYGIGFLANLGSTAPFIGLLGTVWGIMHSFESIATSKNTNLAVVAPGIAEALLATAIGLFVAIPAVIFYNYLSSKVNQLYSTSENFITELYTMLSRVIDEGK